MSLNRRAFVFVLAVVLGTSVVVSAVSGLLTLNALGGVEEQQARDEVSHLEELLELERLKLDGTVQDWGAWDETFEWGMGARPDYPEVNFQPSTLLSIDVDFVGGVDADGTVMFAGMLDRQTPATLPAPRAWEDLLQPGSPLVGLTRDGEATSGFVAIRDTAILVASRPMLPRDRSGEASGTLVFGRALDDDRLGVFHDIVGFDLAVRTSLGEPSDPRVTGATNDLITAASTVSTVAGPGVVTFEVTTPRPVHATAIRTSLLQLLLVGAAGIVPAFAAAWYADRRLLRRVTLLSAEVEEIGTTGEHDRRVTVEGRDEVTRLAADVNAMLDGLEQVQELRARNAELLQADAIRSEFVSMVSHELRTPLTAILGFAETLRQRWDRLDDATRRTLLDRVQRQGDQLLTIINDLLTLTQIQAGVVDVEPRAIHLATFLNDLQDRYPEAMADVEVTVADDAVIWMTPAHLEQCVTNFITNAAKYGRPPVVIDTLPDHDFLLLRVTDHGDGVPEDAIAELFDPFTQASRGTRRQAQGVGLGLAIVRLLTFANGGYAHHETPDEGGARFVLTLPLQASGPLPRDVGPATDRRASERREADRRAGEERREHDRRELERRSTAAPGRPGRAGSSGNGQADEEHTGDPVTVHLDLPEEANRTGQP